MGIPFSYYLSDLGYRLGLRLKFIQGMISLVLGMGMPKTQGCPYHWDTAALPFPQFSPVLFPCSRFESPRARPFLEGIPTNTRPPDLPPDNTRHFDFLSPDRSPNNPRWRQSRNQSTGVYNFLSSSISHNGFPLGKFIVKLWRK